MTAFASAQTGKVGINTAAPNATLDVNGNVIVRTASSTGGEPAILPW